MRLAALFLVAFAALTPDAAHAAHKSGVGWTCASDFDLFVVYGLGTEQHDMADGDSFSWHSPGDFGPVTTCDVGTRSIELHRTFTNTPRARGGACAGADWARYDLRADGETVAKFYLGCVDAILRAHFGVLSMCLDGQNSCRTERWDILKDRPFRGDLIGRWIDVP